MGYNIELFREQLKKLSGNKTGKEIAADIGTTESTVSKWFHTDEKTGKPKSTPKVDDLITISEKYGCSIDSLLGNEKNKEKNTDFSIYELCQMIVSADNALPINIDYNDYSESDLNWYSANILFEARFVEKECLEKADELTLSIINFIKKYLAVKKAELDEETTNIVIQSLIQNAKKEEESITFPI